MAWIEFHQNMPRHKKTLKLARALGVSRREAVGLMCDLWCWGLDNGDKLGCLKGMEAEDVAAALDFPPEQAERLAGALVSSGYLDFGQGGYALHDWYQYAGKLNDRREADRRRKQGALPAALRGNSGGIPYATAPNPTVPNPTVPNPTVPNPAAPDAALRRTGLAAAGARKGFTPPKVGEVAEYCRERGSGVDPAAFVDYYTGQGWLVGKNPMKDWRAVLRSWERRKGPGEGAERYRNLRGLAELFDGKREEEFR